MKQRNVTTQPVISLQLWCKHLEGRDLGCACVPLPVAALGYLGVFLVHEVLWLHSPRWSWAVSLAPGEHSVFHLFLAYRLLPKTLTPPGLLLSLISLLPGAGGSEWWPAYLAARLLCMTGASVVQRHTSQKSSIDCFVLKQYWSVREGNEPPVASLINCLQKRETEVGIYSVLLAPQLPLPITSRLWISLSWGPMADSTKTPQSITLGDCQLD